ncbi:universal stress protein [Variovorax saccharolyticus]|uniref:universal stress protein n=1 Tax=Variovorax saccharolyticus TaxID=3053516 RepID=UPI0025770F3B|nr:universal stress protein [Variovorax sp. J31P216]MDM0024462.1 universal stress protein [Variovorax sp. J31P216]
MLATDLSCRSDRALDRALLLAHRWRARLVVATVLEPTATPGGSRERGAEQREAERRIRADAARDDIDISVRVERGDRVATLLAIADVENCGLIVVGVSKHEGMGRAVVGSTIDALLGRSTVPVLAVRQRARRPYEELIVASDFSSASGHALEQAAHLFPTTALSVFHALEPGPSLATAAGATKDDDARLVQARQRGDAQLAATALPAALREQVRFIFREGDAGRLLEAHGQARCDDLIVLGTHPRHRLLNLLIGSVAQRILERAENDVLSIAEASTPAA